MVKKKRVPTAPPPRQKNGKNVCDSPHTQPKKKTDEILIQFPFVTLDSKKTEHEFITTMTNFQPHFNNSSNRFVIIGVLIFRFLLRSSHSFQLLRSRRYDRFTVTTRESISFPIHHQPCEISTCAFHPIGKLNSCSKTRLYFDDRSADMMEALVGGMRYEMVELPDSLVDTTVFVGNLCEFVSDEDLSSLFQQVSTLNFLPACVARKPNSSSLCYGFVTFPTVEEKEVGSCLFSIILVDY